MGEWTYRSPYVQYLENSMAYWYSSSYIKMCICFLHKICPINVWRVTVETHAEMNADIRVKCPSLLSARNESSSANKFWSNVPVPNFMKITFEFLEYFFVRMDGRLQREQQTLRGAPDEPEIELCSPSVVNTKTRNKQKCKHRWDAKNNETCQV
jgi:hypothetical protein